MKYTIQDFKNQFPNDDICLDYLFQQGYGEIHDFKKYYRVKGRKCYAHSESGVQLHPLAGTIFHKSSTKLTNWFHAMFLFSQSKNGVSAKELQRHIGVTYKCAYRMGQQIRLLMKQKPSMLDGTVEADETYLGGRKNRKKGHALGKNAVFGVIERQGIVKSVVVPNTEAYTLMGHIKENVLKTAHLMTDEHHSYKNAHWHGYQHSRIKHNKKIWVKGNIHTNTIENYWGAVKRSIRGTYIHVSKRKLQNYLDEFSWNYNARRASVHPFSLLLAKV